MVGFDLFAGDVISREALPATFVPIDSPPPTPVWRLLWLFLGPVVSYFGLQGPSLSTTLAGPLSSFITHALQQARGILLPLCPQVKYFTILTRLTLSRWQILWAP